uniref:Uncharacterized protein n=1 Tax=Rhizophora mucronata TaxID=61149 RepID=A0A2P2NIT8_RHIMU
MPKNLLLLLLANVFDLFIFPLQKLAHYQEGQYVIKNSTKKPSTCNNQLKWLRGVPLNAT